MARRFGGVKKLDSGQYLARYTDPRTGKRVSAPKTFRRQRDALDWLVGVEADLNRGVAQDYSSGKIRLSDWCDLWVANRKGAVKVRTFEGYESNIKVHIKPYLGHLRLHDISPEIVRRWLDERRATGKHPAAAQAYRTLAAIMKAAVEDRRIPSSPCTVSGGGKTPSTEVVFLTSEECSRLVNAMDERFRMLVALAAVTGFRWGELLGLRVKDFDSKRSTITVHRQIVETKAGHAVGTPKSKAGLRSVALPTWIIDPLLEHIERYCDGNTYLFVMPDGSHPRRSNFNRRYWKPAKEAAGVPARLRLHDLRHTMASLALDAGANMLLIQKRLGHANISTTLGTYSHLLPAADQQVADAMVSLF